MKLVRRLVMIDFKNLEKFDMLNYYYLPKMTEFPR